MVREVFQESRIDLAREARSERGLWNNARNEAVYHAGAPRPLRLPVTSREDDAKGCAREECSSALADRTLSITHRLPRDRSTVQESARSLGDESAPHQLNAPWRRCRRDPVGP